MNDSNTARAAWGDALVNQKLAENAWWASHENDNASKDDTDKLLDVLCDCEKVADKAEAVYCSTVALEKLQRADKLEIEEQMIISGKMRDPNDVHSDIA
jgi:hypothetical protein